LRHLTNKVQRLAGGLKRMALHGARFIAPALNLLPKRQCAPCTIVILMRKPLGIGDLLMLSPVVSVVAGMNHGLRVLLVTEYPELFRIPGVEWLHPERLAKEVLRGSLVVSPTLSWHHFPYLLQAAAHIGYFLSDRLSCSFCEVDARYNARHEHYSDRAGALVAAMRRLWSSGAGNSGYPLLLKEPIGHFDLPSAYFCLAPFSNWPERQYPPEHWKTVVKALLQRLPVVLVGGSLPDELAMAAALQERGVINLAGRTSIGQLVSVLSGCSVYLGNDSGPSHIAFLSAPASVVVFGCVGGRQRIPLDPRLAASIRTLGNGVACPHFPCYDGFAKPYCKHIDRYVCLRTVCPHAVLDEVFSVMGERG